MNLVSNAAEAMPNGGTITIHSENRHADTPINTFDEDAFNKDLTVNVEAIGEMLGEKITPEEGADAYYLLFKEATASLKEDDFTQGKGPKVEAISKAIGFDVIAEERDVFWARMEKEKQE
jgi:hypothetical protein